MAKGYVPVCQWLPSYLCPKEQLLGPSTIVREGTKSSTLDRLGGALVHQAIPRGRVLQRGTSCFKANLICSCSRIQARKNHPKIGAFCWPLGAFEVKVSEVSFYCIAITQFYHLSCICFPQAHPAQFCITLISYCCFLATSSFLFLTSWKIKKTIINLKSQQRISSLSSLSQLTWTVFLLLAWIIWASWGESVWLGWGCCLACKRLLRWNF